MDTSRDFLQDQIDASPCICGHRPEAHKHLDVCKQDGCDCVVYIPEAEEGP